MRYFFVGFVMLLTVSVWAADNESVAAISFNPSRLGKYDYLHATHAKFSELTISEDAEANIYGEEVSVDKFSGAPAVTIATITPISEANTFLEVENAYTLKAQPSVPASQQPIKTAGDPPNWHASYTGVNITVTGGTFFAKKAVIEKLVSAAEKITLDASNASVEVAGTIQADNLVIGGAKIKIDIDSGGPGKLGTYVWVWGTDGRLKRGLQKYADPVN